MPFFDQFPYTNFHEINLDWIIKTIMATTRLVNALQIRVTETLPEEVYNYVDNHLESFVLHASYDEDNTAINLEGQI